MPSTQTKILIYGTAGIAAAGGLFWAMLRVLDGWPGAMPDPGERVALALKFAVLPAGFVLLVVLVIALTRFLTGNVNAIDDKPARWRAVDMRVLSNSVEQTVVFLPVYVAAALVLRADETALLAALPVTFVAARLGFWIGYRVSDLGRAPGMAAGFAVNLALLGFVVVRFLG